MGKYAFDQYSILHFSSGVVAYFFGVPFTAWVILHILFEVIENSPTGIHVINTYLKIWPGGKPGSDTLTNSAFDTLFAIFGYLTAKKLDEIYKRKNALRK